MTGTSRRRQIITILVALLTAALLAVVLTRSRNSAPSMGARRVLSAAPPVGATIGSPSSAAPSPVPDKAPLPATTSPDLYAAAVARALWSVDYTQTSRPAEVAFWRRELALTLPAGTPAGTTLAQAQGAAMTTLAQLIPTAATWPTLAADHARSTFTVTAVSEPGSWVAAVSAGQISDPGLTARTVLGVQTLTYGDAPDSSTSAQSQQLTVVMLCPPTTTACRLEILPPPGTDGTN